VVTLEVIRKELEEKLAADKGLRYVEVRAETLEEALADAAVQLDTRTSALEYEIIERGSPGFMGLAKAPFMVRVYENAALAPKKAKKTSEIVITDEEVTAEEQAAVKDGVFFVHYFGPDVSLKVIPPQGGGLPVDYKDVTAAITRPGVKSIDEGKIKRLAGAGTNSEYETVGEYEHNQAKDAIFTIDVSADGMEALISASAPGAGGSDISPTRIKQSLKANGVLDGYDTQLLLDFVDSPVYGTPTVVARGSAPVDGKDAYMSYNFETDTTKFKIKEAEDGSVNYKELNLIQNVVEGQPLAQKIPAEMGKAGLTLLGAYLEAKDGRDIKLPLGKNVRVDSDGCTIVAETNGQVLLVADKINVEPIMQVDGDVSIKTGNITFLGTVIVKGGVEDGFNIKAAGNIEVSGTVGKCRLEAEGDIVVALGILGRDEAFIKAGKSLWAKFIQNAQVEAEENVFVSDGIINADVTANKKIILQGKRAAIIGGHMFATEEIHAKNIGSSAGGNETILEVGYDPRAKRRLDSLIDEQAKLVKELEELELNIQTMENQMKVRRNLPPDKEENYKKLVARKAEITLESTTISAEIREIQDRLQNLKIAGKVSVSGTTYTGVKVYIRDAKDDVRTEVKAVTFYYDNGFVKRGKLEALDESELKRSPDGYTAD
jgi:uncharacterized protein (DUF342 family)